MPVNYIYIYKLYYVIYSEDSAPGNIHMIKVTFIKATESTVNISNFFFFFCRMIGRKCLCGTVNAINCS